MQIQLYIFYEILLFILFSLVQLMNVNIHI
jgi:hypothetical protein